MILYHCPYPYSKFVSLDLYLILTRTHIPAYANTFPFFGNNYVVVRLLKGSRVTSGYKLATVEIKYTLPDVLLKNGSLNVHSCR